MSITSEPSTWQITQPQATDPNTWIVAIILSGDGIVKVVFVQSKMQKADLYTKNTPQEIYKKHTKEYIEELPKWDDEAMRKGVGMVS